MIYHRPAAWLLLAGACCALSACEQEEGQLEGPAPTASFNVQLNTTQYPVVATFTSTSQNGFLYQWDFGDGSSLESRETVTHTYTRPGAYTVKLAVAGRGGTSFAPQTVTIPTACSNAAFGVLVACSGSGSTSWTFSDQAGAIRRLSASGAVLSSSTAPLPLCQADDQFSFTNTFAYAYDAAGGTYVGGTCGTARNSNGGFIFKPNGNLGQIILQGRGAFIGLPDSVSNKTYDILEATATRLRLQGTNPDGTKTEVTLMPQLSAIDRAKQLLTGGSTRTWLLDNTQAAAIVVGPSDADPTSYYPGGAAGSLPGCQADDEFTFTTANQYTYNAFAETLVAGAAGCSAPRSGSSAFTFGAATGAGIAQFELTSPTAFIGVTDAANRIYRIISIDNQHMVLRVGPPSGAVVHTMKLRVK
jgi:PKD repeat protein